MWAGSGVNDSTPDIHECRPPVWLPKTHASADLGQYLLDVAAMSN
jgi:hypothetical protein